MASRSGTCAAWSATRPRSRGDVAAGLSLRGLATADLATLLFYFNVAGLILAR